MSTKTIKKNISKSKELKLKLHRQMMLELDIPDINKIFKKQLELEKMEKNISESKIILDLEKKNFELEKQLFDCEKEKFNLDKKKLEIDKIRLYELADKFGFVEHNKKNNFDKTYNNLDNLFGLENHKKISKPLNQIKHPNNINKYTNFDDFYN